MKHSRLDVVSHLMVFFTPVTQQEVNSTKSFFFQDGENKLMSLKVCIAGAPASECSIQERSDILLSYKSCMSEGAAGSLFS